MRSIVGCVVALTVVACLMPSAQTQSGGGIVIGRSLVALPQRTVGGGALLPACPGICYRGPTDFVTPAPGGNTPFQGISSGGGDCACAFTKLATPVPGIEWACVPTSFNCPQQYYIAEITVGDVGSACLAAGGPFATICVPAGSCVHSAFGVDLVQVNCPFVCYDAGSGCIVLSINCSVVATTIGTQPPNRVAYVVGFGCGCTTSCSAHLAGAPPTGTEVFADIERVSLANGGSQLLTLRLLPNPNRQPALRSFELRSQWMDARYSLGHGTSSAAGLRTFGDIDANLYETHCLAAGMLDAHGSASAQIVVPPASANVLAGETLVSWFVVREHGRLLTVSEPVVLHLAQ